MPGMVGSIFKLLTPKKRCKRPLTGVYLSFFLMVTLLILVGSTWMGLYLTKRITGPVQRLAAAAREIGAGRLDQRVEPQSNDEFGSLVEAFNTMAGELAASRRKVDRATIELERKHQEVEGRRRYIETILERSLLRPHGLLVVDNTMWGGEVLNPRALPPIEEAATGEQWMERMFASWGHELVKFNRYVAEDPRVRTVLLTVHDGMTLIQLAS